MRPVFRNFPTVLACALLTSCVAATAADNHVDPAAAPTQSRAAAREGFSSDFEVAFEEARSVGNGPATITGVLPRDLIDDSAWAEVTVHYDRLTTDPFAGESAVRMDVRRVDKGQAQISLRRASIYEDRAIELSFAVRSTTATPVQVKLQQKSSPYRMRWETVVPAAAEWTQITRTIDPGLTDEDTQLLFVIDRPGIVDLDGLSLQYVEREHRQTDSPHSRNLLPVSSFPDGVASPWLIRDGLVATTDEAVVGPTGQRALRVEAESDLGQAPFTASILLGFHATPRQTHTLSLHVKAEKPGADLAIRFGPPSKRIYTDPYSVTTPLSTEWKRYHHSVELPANEDGYYTLQLAFSRGTAVWIDGLQLEQAEAPGDFQRTGPTELTLQPAENLGLVSGTTPMIVRYSVIGDLPPGARVERKLTRIGGESAALDPLALDDATLADQPLRLALDEAAAFGSYRLEARVVSEDGLALSRWSEALLHRVHPARFAEEARPDSPFGAHWGTGHLTDADLRVVNQLGVKWLRLFTTVAWHAVETRPLEYDFTRADRDVALLEKHHLMGLAIVGAGAPAWYADNPHGYRGWARFAPTQIEPWRRYCDAVVARYAGRLNHYEAWNEPYWPHFFTDTVTADGVRKIGSVEDYVAVQKALWDATRQHHPDTTVAWNTSYTSAPQRTEETIAAGVLDYANLVTIHQYHGSPDIQATLIKHGEQMRGAMGDRADNVPIWNSEGGHGMAQLFNIYAHAPPQRSAEHAVFWADWMCRYYLGTIESGVNKFFIYLFQPTSWWREDYAISNVDGRLGPNATALAHLFWQLEGTTFRERIERADGLRAMVFADDAHTVLVIDHAGTVGQTPALTIEGQRYDLWGNAIAIDAPLTREITYLRTNVPAPAVLDLLRQPTP